MISYHTIVSYLRNLKIEGWIGYIQRVLNRWNPNLSIDPGLDSKPTVFVKFIMFSINFSLECRLNSNSTKTLISLFKNLCRFHSERGCVKRSVTEKEESRVHLKRRLMTQGGEDAKYMNCSAWMILCENCVYVLHKLR